jgi:hypothetical protein
MGGIDRSDTLGFLVSLSVVLRQATEYNNIQHVNNTEATNDAKRFISTPFGWFTVPIPNRQATANRSTRHAFAKAFASKQTGLKPSQKITYSFVFVPISNESSGREQFLFQMHLAVAKTVYQ